MKVCKVTTDQERSQAYGIRELVFVQEQQVDPEEEYDKYDLTANHFIAYDANSQACGTARWRKTDWGIKLERFAVLNSHRSQGVGSILLRAALKDIDEYLKQESSLVYLHAQTSAVPFYEKHGFKKVGQEFEECNIKHFKMIRE